MKKLFQTLHLNEVGVFELLVALYPIISQYAWGIVHMNFVMFLLLDVIAFVKNPKTIWFKRLTILTVFYALHELIVYVFFAGMPTYMIGDVMSSLIIAISIPIVVSAVNYQKLVGSFHWVALLCLGGLFYHYMLIISGNVSSIHPLTLPLFPAQDMSSRAFEDIFRPTSFFWEPSSYATFMVIPLFLCLSERNFVMGSIYALSLFLSSSTNGIIFVVVLLAVFFIRGSLKWYHKALLLILAVALGYSLFNMEYFSQGVDKMENTEIMSSQRIMNGPNLVAATPGEYLILGADAANINDFLLKHPEINTGKLIFLKSGSLFVSDFWRILVKYGVLGLILVLLMYVRVIKRCEPLRPYLYVLVVALFSQSVVLGSSWGYEWVFILAYLLNYERTR